jgi:hypothetical protein
MGFYDDLDYSRDERFNRAYKRQFAGLKEIIEVEDIDFQRMGIDKVLVLSSTKRIFVEEKVRRSHYGDICLELWSNKELGKQGWLHTVQADFLAYMTPKRVYLLHTEQLRTAWHYKKSEWLKKYKTRTSRTENKYTTEWIAIPEQELLEAMTNTMVWNSNVWS